MADAPRDTGFYDTAYGHFSDELYAASVKRRSARTSARTRKPLTHLLG